MIDWTYFQVALNPGTVLTAVATGAIMGYWGYWAVMRVFVRPDQLEERVPPLTTLGTFFTSVVAGSSFAAAFYLSQTLAEYLEGFPTWPRILGRGIVFLVYVVAFAATFALRIRNTDRERKQRSVNGTLPNDSDQGTDSGSRSDT